MSDILKVNNLVAGYGVQDVIFDVSATIGPGEIVAIIGPNGAGKSTLLKVIAGMLTPRNGNILLKGSPLNGCHPWQITSRGISWVPQDDNVFASMSVRDNLEMGAYLVRENTSERIEEVCDLFPQLKERMGQLAGSLSGGQRQMLAIARGLMTHPDLLLLDEPTAGLAPNLIYIMLEQIREITARLKSSVLLVTQTLDAVRLSDRGYLMSAGKIRYEDSTDKFLANQDVKELYFGGRVSSP
ncbi:MAG TPA: ABC transporter ATP-binding protein [Firmicutes bacterium]|jgi:ABC-type branched-subunit amino acid transport system ATPase component|nr:ABC transporter ATP-binding protein [Bacillota bacterium]